MVCLRHNGKCTYCGFDLLSSQAICYHFWCIDHLLPQVRYRELEDHPENKVLSCPRCNSVKSDYDPNAGSLIYSGNGQLTAEQREELLDKAREYVRQKNTQLNESFCKELELLKPFIRR